MDLRERAELIDRLESAIHYGESHIGRVPGLLKEILDNDAWKEFKTKKGVIIKHTDFEEFVTTKEPYKGLGAKIELIKGIASQDPELETLVGKALRKPQRGNPTGNNQHTNRGNVFNEDISSEEKNDEVSQLTFPEKEEEIPKKKKREKYGEKALRLKKDYPELYAQVLRSEKTINAAAIEAGIYPTQITVNPSNPKSAKTLLEKASPEFIAELRRLLNN